MKLSHTLWVTPDSAYRLKDFLCGHLGIDTTKTPNEAISVVQGLQFVVSLGHRIIHKEGEKPRIVMDIKSTRAAN